MSGYFVACQPNLDLSGGGDILAILETGQALPIVQSDTVLVLRYSAFDWLPERSSDCPVLGRLISADVDLPPKGRYGWEAVCPRLVGALPKQTFDTRYDLVGSKGAAYRLCWSKPALRSFARHLIAPRRRWTRIVELAWRQNSSTPLSRSSSRSSSSVPSRGRASFTLMAPEAPSSSEAGARSQSHVECCQQQPRSCGVESKGRGAADCRNRQ